MSIDSASTHLFPSTGLGPTSLVAPATVLYAPDSSFLSNPPIHLSAPAPKFGQAQVGGGDYPSPISIPVSGWSARTIPSRPQFSRRSTSPPEHDEHGITNAGSYEPSPSSYFGAPVAPEFNFPTSSPPTHDVAEGAIQLAPFFTEADADHSPAYPFAPSPPSSTSIALSTMFGDVEGREDMVGAVEQGRSLVGEVESGSAEHAVDEVWEDGGGAGAILKRGWSEEPARDTKRPRLGGMRKYVGARRCSPMWSHLRATRAHALLISHRASLGW